MRIVFMGTPDFSVQPLEALIREHEVLCVLTGEDKPRGRGQSLHPTPVKEAALREGITVYTPKTLRNPEIYEKLKVLSADVFVVVAYGKILPKEILELPKYGCINIHASLLPAYRGAAPIQWAVMDGQKISGITTMMMDEGLDTGDILCQYPVEIAQDETGGSLFDKLATLGAEAILDTLAHVQVGNLTKTKQGETTTAYAAMLRKEDGDIDFSLSAEEIERRVRGLSPWPGAFTGLSGKLLRIWKTEITTDSFEPEISGQLRSTDNPNILISKKEMFLRCKPGYLRVLELQPEGKKRMDTASFLRGFKEVGDVL